VAPPRLLVAARAAIEREVAHEVAALVRARPETVLGVASGATPLGVWRELARLRRDEGLDLSRTRAFQLDEYLDLPPDDPRTFRAQLDETCFGPLGIPPDRAYVPHPAPSGADEEAARYERAILDAGGVDLWILGVGRNGHVGFNEPGSDPASRTRAVELAPETREDAAPAFGGLQHVPTRAITVGIATILSATRLRVLAFGPHKAAILRRALHHPISRAVPATFLRHHPGARWYLDPDAASEL
jgi:glucosamine-6-phosphate deaminase